MINLSPSKTEEVIKAKIEDIALMNKCSSRKVKYDLLAYILLGVKSEISNDATNDLRIKKQKLAEKIAHRYRVDVRVAAASKELPTHDEFAELLSELATCD